MIIIGYNLLNKINITTYFENLTVELHVLYTFNKINITTYFENLTVELHVLYTFDTHVKFYVNHILFTILFISFYFMHNFKL